MGEKGKKFRLGHPGPPFPFEGKIKKRGGGAGGTGGAGGFWGKTWFADRPFLCYNAMGGGAPDPP